MALIALAAQRLSHGGSSRIPHRFAEWEQAVGSRRAPLDYDGMVPYTLVTIRRILRVTAAFFVILTLLGMFLAFRQLG